jgi:uncharacterized DUF497 family protein
MIWLQRGRVFDGQTPWPSIKILYYFSANRFQQNNAASAEKLAGDGPLPHHFRLASAHSQCQISNTAKALSSYFVCAYNAHMKAPKIYNWNSEKNQLLLRERGISFERIVFEISAENELDVLQYPNQEKYPGQRISVVQVDEYVYAVPFIETETEIFLKTIIPSRKATRQNRSS